MFALLILLPIIPAFKVNESFRYSGDFVLDTKYLLIRGQDSFRTSR